MRAAFMTLTFIACTMSAARADCLRDLGQFHEQVAAEDQSRPTAQTQAAVRALQKLERNEQADEIDCINTLVRARQILAAPVPPTTNDRYARDRHRQ
jgi:hypothetical protein